VLKFENSESVDNWKEQFDRIKRKVEQSNKSFIKTKDKINSFAPLRTGNKLRWFLCGQAYYRRVEEAINAAKEEIFICGWWLLLRLKNQYII